MATTKKEKEVTVLSEKEVMLLELSENGKKEVKELNLTLRGEKYSAIIVMDFNLLRKAMGALITTDLSKTGKDTKVNVGIDDLGAGDKLLFNGWHSGDDDIKRKMGLRVKACKELGKWLHEYMNKDTDEEEELEEEKKS